MKRVRNQFTDEDGGLWTVAMLVKWRRVGTDPRVVDISLNRQRALGRRPEVWVCAVAAFVVLWVAVSWFYDVTGLLRTTHAARWSALRTSIVGLASCVLGARAERRRVRLDPTGLTIVNFLRTQRVRWSDVDDVVLEGYPGVTLLTRDRVIAIEALHCPELPWLPLGLGRRLEFRDELDVVRVRLTSIRDAAVVSGARR